MSESVVSREDCILELQSMSTQDKVVGRDYFRANAEISEKDWSRHFGTWNEFKKAAEVAPSRGQEKFLRETAKHASVDKLRKATKEKQTWEGKYLFDTSNERWKKVLVASDVHDKQCDPYYRRLFIDTAKRYQPDKLILNGDIFDLEEFSRYDHDPREFDIAGSIKWVQAFFKDIRDACPNTELLLVEGNHEARLAKHLAESSPALTSLMSDFHGWGIENILGLDKFGINYYAKANLAAFTSNQLKLETSKNFVKIYDSLLFHHFPHGAQYGYPGSNGHHHSHQCHHLHNMDFGPYEWHQTGCGHKRAASYCDGDKWANGFLLCHVDIHKRRTQFEYIDCTGDMTVIGGKQYIREDEEMLGPIIVSMDTVRKMKKKKLK